MEIRAESDAVLVSFATVAADTMTMGMPDAGLRAARVARGQGEYPLRVILSGSGLVDAGLRLFGENFSQVVVYSTERMPEAVRSGLRGRAEVRLGEGSRVLPEFVLRSLGEEFGVKRVAFEGGGTLFWDFLKAGCVDELCLTLCPLVFGGKEGVTLTGTGLCYLPASVKASLRGLERVGDECFTRWRLRFSSVDGEFKEKGDSSVDSPEKEA